MNTFFISLQRYAPSVLRYGLAAVMLWFSSEQFLHTVQWTAYIPDSLVTLTHFKATTLVVFNATFEAIFGLLLMIGWHVRISALLLTLHLLDIMYVIGYGEIATRDFGLAVAMCAVFMNGPDLLSIDRKPTPITETNVTH